MLFGIFFTHTFYELQTDVAQIRQLGFDYTSIVCICAFGGANQVALERMLVATGKPIGSVFSLTTGTLVNLILDPILIFGYFGCPALGMRGAAIATVAAQFSAALVAFGFNLAVNKEIHFHFGMLKPIKKTLKNIWNVGFPAALQQSISPLMIFGMNQILLGFTIAALAVYVIYVRLQSIVLIPIWGLKNTVVSIISYNFGAGLKERIKQTIHLCLTATILITLFGLLIFQLIPQSLLALFNASGEVLEIGTIALRIVSFVFPFSGLTLILGAFLQALGNSKKTLITSIAQLILMLISAAVLAHIGSVNTVWFAFIITEAVIACLAAFFMKNVYTSTL